MRGEHRRIFGGEDIGESLVIEDTRSGGSGFFARKVQGMT